MDRHSLSRHRDRHLTPALVRVAADRADAGALTAHERVEQLYQRVVSLLDAAEQEGKASLTLSAIREARSCAELLARLSGELKPDGPQMQLLFTQDPGWQQFAAGLLTILERHATPEVQRLVMAEMKAMHGMDSPPSDAGAVVGAALALPAPRGVAS